jgi:hypothetical protein
MQQKGGANLAPPQLAVYQAAFFRVEVLRPDELVPARLDEEPRPVEVLRPAVLPRLEDEAFELPPLAEALRPDEMLRVEPPLLALPEPREGVADARLLELLLFPLACSSSG